MVVEFGTSSNKASAWAGGNDFSPLASKSFPCLDPHLVVKGKWFAVVSCCACLREEAMVSIVLCMSKGGGHGFNVGALF